MHIFMRLQRHCVEKGKTMSESRTKKSAINITFTFGARIITLILGFVSRMIFLRFLSVEYLGINGLFTNVLTMLSFAELGIGNAIQFGLYKPLKEHNIEKIKSLMCFYKKAYRIIALFVAVVGIALLPALDFIIESKPDIPESLSVIYCLFILNSASSYLFSYKQTLLHADQNAYIVSIGNSVAAIVQNVVHIVILYTTGNYLVYLISTISFTIITNAAIAIYVNKKYPYLTEKNINKLERNEFGRIVTDVKALSISKVAGIACNGTDNIIITKIIGLSSVGYASNYTLIINTMSGMLYAMLSSITGSIGNLNAEKDTSKREGVYNQILMLSYLVYSCICTCIIVLINQFIGEVWLSEEYVVGMVTTVSLVLIAFQSGMNFTAYNFRTTLGYFDEVKYVYVATAVVNILLSILLGKFIGLSGVFFATTISKLITSEIADGYYSYKKGLNKDPKIYYVKLLGYYFLFGANTAICYFMINAISLNGIVAFLVKGTMCFVLTNLINVIVVFRTDSFRELVKKIKLILHRKRVKM